MQPATSSNPPAPGTDARPAHARIEDYALLSDCRGSALVSKDGSVDWMCLPRFDSDAVFARLLGEDDHGYWQICPSGSFSIARRYQPGTMVLQTTFTAGEAEVVLEDALIIDSCRPMLVRTVIGVRGRMPLETRIVLRADYGSTRPWVTRTDYGLRAIAGPDEWNLQSPVPLEGQRAAQRCGSFEVGAGDRLAFVLSWQSSHGTAFEPQRHPAAEVARTVRFWAEFSSRTTYRGPHKEAVARSLLTLKALTYQPTGGIVAAPTTSLPEEIGGQRNWDYRYCWIRDATFSVYALMLAGHRQEAAQWVDWLVKAVAGDPAQAHMVYGVAGEKRLVESELPWLPGYEGSRPVRIGNGAYDQLQIDVFGEVIGTLTAALRNDVPVDASAWRIQECFMEFLERNWNCPDEGIWEIRGERRHFTHSKVMAWVAVDRAICNARLMGIKEPLDEWQALKQRIHSEVCAQGFDTRRNSFVQVYGSRELDASLLMIPIVGFLPPDDPRVRGTVAAIEKELMQDGYVRRYDTSAGNDGVGGAEGAFIACSYWLADAWLLMGRRREARELFEHLLTLRNDVGLLSEEYDPVRQRLVGNFPQAFSHIALVNTAFGLFDPPGQGQQDTQAGTDASASIDTEHSHA